MKPLSNHLSGHRPMVRPMLPLLSLLLTAWCSPWAVAAAPAAPLEVRSVAVFVTSATPLIVPQKTAYALEVYRVDALELAQKALLAPAGTGRTERETEVLQRTYLREKGKDPLHKLAPLISRHYQGEQLARQHGITGYPAIVINNSKVVYDVTDVERAIAIYMKLKGN